VLLLRWLVEWVVGSGYFAVVDWVAGGLGHCVVVVVVVVVVASLRLDLDLSAVASQIWTEKIQTNNPKVGDIGTIDQPVTFGPMKTARQTTRSRNPNFPARSKNPKYFNPECPE
jgi:hypothetical protein